MQYGHKDQFIPKDLGAWLYIAKINQGSLGSFFLSRLYYQSLITDGLIIIHLLMKDHLHFFRMTESYLHFQVRQ